MIAKETVFILGAGASKPYGFPIGRELVELLLHEFKTERSVFSLALQGMEFGRGANAARSLPEFIADLSDSGAESVDAFLEHRPDLVAVGKYAIAVALLLAEGTHVAGQHRPGGDWYRQLLGSMNAPFERFHENKASFITYNYDRSLEDFLFKALRVRQRMEHGDDEWATKMRDSVPIIHLHGQLGAYPRLLHDQGAVPVPYGTDWEDGHLVKAAGDAIRIIHEDFDLDHDPAFRRAYDLLSKAKFVFFVGFGYHTTNLDRLRLKQFIHPAATVYGTAFELKDAEKRRIVSTVRSRVPESVGVTIAPSDYDAVAFLRENDTFQSFLGEGG